MLRGKTIFNSPSNVTVIEPTLKAIEEYGTNCGYEVVELNEDDINAIRNGKMLAFDDGEYSTFLIYNKE